MDASHDPNIWQNLLVLLQTLLAILTQLAVFGFQYLLWIVFAAVCLWGINWKRARHFLAVGGWVPVVLLMLVIALVWSRIVPGACPTCGLASFWWQLGYVGMLAAIAMFCGWLQSVMHWTPADINLEPPAQVHGHDHGHGHH